MSGSNEPTDRASALSVEPIDRLVGPLARFLHVEAASGVVLLRWLLPEVPPAANEAR
ncbi:MAG: hypothetical protein HRU01_02400 [Myxococcales bacterium]|nr:hypothetical protein [Myxococcales bacterium]